MKLQALNFPSGKTVSYRITNLTLGTTPVAWTSVGVTELVTDVTAAKSIYYVEDSTILPGSEYVVDWKTNDTTPFTASEGFDKLATNLHNLALRLDVPAAPTYTSIAGSIPTGTYTYRVSATNERGESLPSSSSTVSTTMLATPVNLPFASTVGTLGAGTYYYRVSATNALGQTLASTETSLTLGAVGGVVVNWGVVTGATGYKIYGRSTGAELLMATVGAVTTWTDDGSVTPSGALPASNTTSGITVHWVAIPYATGYKVYGRTAPELLLATITSGATTSWGDTYAVTPSGAYLTVPTDGIEALVRDSELDIEAIKAKTDIMVFDGSNLNATIGRPVGSVVSNVANSGTTFQISLTASDWGGVLVDGCVRGFIKFTSGALKGQESKIDNYVASSSMISVLAAFTGTPAAADTFKIINE